jgi:DNA polymerase-3 subunit delta
MVYLFTGEEDFLREEAIRELEQKLLKKDSSEFNKNIFYGQDMDGSEINDIATVLPMLSQKRLIIIKQSEKLSPSVKENLISYIESPSPATCLILDATSLNKQDRLYKAVSQHGRIINFKKYYSGQIDRWIIRRVRFYKKRILPEAAGMLRENVGENLRILNESIKKLVLYVGENEVIKVRDIEEVVGRSFGGTVFDLIKAIRQREKSKALRIVSELVKEGKETSSIIGLLFWQLKRIKEVKRLLEQGVLSEEIGRRLKIHNFFLDEFITEVRNFCSRELNRHFKFLLEADTEIKMGIKKPEIALELLVIKLSVC